MSETQEPRERSLKPAAEDFEVFYRDSYQAVSRYVARRVGPNSHDDVVASTFVVAWRKFATVTSPSLPWLYRIASYEVAHERRRLGRQTPIAELNDLNLIDTAPMSEVFEVSTAFSQLSESDAELLRLVYWENLNRNDIAEILGLSVNAVNVRYHRALNRLAGSLSRLANVVGTNQPTEPHPEETK